MAKKKSAKRSAAKKTPQKKVKDVVDQIQSELSDRSTQPEWDNDEYIRQLLDSREKWGTVLSLTGIAGLLLILPDKPHRTWVEFGPLLIGLIGTFYVFVVNSYYEQAEAISKAKSNEEKVKLKEASWHTFSHRIGFLGKFNILVPLIAGLFATLTLLFGLSR